MFEKLSKRYLYLNAKGGFSFTHQGFRQPMYKSVSEVVDVIKIALQEGTAKTIESFKTIESGVVEEYAVIERSEAGKSLLFRVWPVFYRHDKRIEYKIYSNDKPRQEIIVYYLHVCAVTNNAKLISK